ncbi:MAG: hypothetical protein M1416_01485 [Candidatus Pacearchaeota archaeon]|nr:hypothetical protein [Candidatus Pacearchaeota archaeon]
MKQKLNEYVGSLSNEIKDEIVKGVYEKEMYYEIRMTLDSIHHSASIKNEERVKTYQSIYNQRKKMLEEKNLWDERFDSCYKQALEGKLNSNKLMKIRLK